MRRLFDTLLVTLPGFVNVGGLLLLLLFIYAAVGMQLFAKVGYHGAVTPHAHFRRIDTALLTLLRFATGENFNGYAHDMARGPDDCVTDPSTTSTCAASRTTSAACRSTAAAAPRRCRSS